MFLKLDYLIHGKSPTHHLDAKSDFKITDPPFFLPFKSNDIKYNIIIA